MTKFVSIIVLADGSYGPLEGAQIIAIPEELNDSESIEEIIDGNAMFDHPPSDHSEGFIVATFDVEENP